MAATTDLVYDQRVRRAASALRDAGWKMALVGREKAGSLQAVLEGVEIHRLTPDYEGGKMMYLSFNWKLFRYLMGRGEAVFVANDMDTLPAVWLAARLKGRTLVFDAHEYFSEVPEVISRPITRRIWQVLEGSLIPKVDLAYTVSGSLAELFAKLYKVPFGVVRNVPNKASTFPPKSQVRTIVYAGALNKGRALEHLIDALPQLPAEVTLRLCGDGDIVQKLKERVSALALESRVAFTGYLKPEQLRMAVAQGWLGFCCAEPLGVSYRLSLSNKFFEYIQAGLPQLMPPFEEFIRINAPYGLGIEVEADAGKLAEAIQSLLNDEALYARCRAGALRAAQDLNWEKESQVLVALYEALL